MSGVQKILVPINFSEDSANSLQYAISLARETQAEIIVLHVTQKEEAASFLNFLAVMEGSPVLNPPPRIPVDRLLREKALDLYRFIEKVVRNPGQLRIIRKVALGNKEEKILETVQAENVDLVVLAVPKKSFFLHLPARAKFVKMISRFPCPVLLKQPLFEPVGWSALAR